MMRLAHYAGRPATPLSWHTDARIYTLDPPALAAINELFVVEIDAILVSGFLEATRMTANGKPVYRRWTVCATLDLQCSIWEAWIEGQISHEKALNKLGYNMIGKP
jgi:hypothetical protein